MMYRYVTHLLIAISIPASTLYGSSVSLGSRPDACNGINAGSWLLPEYFITPTFFESVGVVDPHDMYTLNQKLGENARSHATNHYSTFYSEKDFENIAKKGHFF